MFAFIPKLWLKRTALFLSGLNAAYAIKTFLMYGACYLGYCPEKKMGLFLMLLSTIFLLIAAMFPAGRIMMGAIPANLPEETQKAETQKEETPPAPESL